MPQEQVIYFGYKVRQVGTGFDSALASDMNQRVYVYSYNASVRQPPRPDPSIPTFKPTIVAVLDIRNGSIAFMNNWPVRTSWRHWWPTLQYGIHVDVIGRDTVSAIIRLCRQEAFVWPFELDVLC